MRWPSTSRLITMLLKHGGLPGPVILNIMFQIKRCQNLSVNIEYRNPLKGLQICKCLIFKHWFVLQNAAFLRRWPTKVRPKAHFVPLMKWNLTTVKHCIELDIEELSVWQKSLDLGLRCKTLFEKSWEIHNDMTGCVMWTWSVSVVKNLFWSFFIRLLAYTMNHPCALNLSLALQEMAVHECVG